MDLHKVHPNLVVLLNYSELTYGSGAGVLRKSSTSSSEELSLLEARISCSDNLFRGGRVEWLSLKLVLNDVGSSTVVESCSVGSSGNLEMKFETEN
jgi:hypothetical protein